MKAVYKYPLQITDCQKVTLPVGAKPINAAMQNGELFVWCLVDVNEPAETSVPFNVVGTGHHHEEFGTYLDTVLLHGALVFHIFYGD